MNPNQIIADLHRHREALARSCGYDAKKLMDYYRRREKEHPGGGRWRLDHTSPAAATAPAPSLREEPPKP
jgi:hypothetical protein